ncbi:MAG: DUF342 domain-containing protein, partial [Leptospiraceae bacterium]|nr:DUF342 domain-containing protein [Leptospiraceae bacterium]
MPRNEFFDSLLQEIEDNEDGNFQIRNEGGFAVLSVSKPGKNGRRIELNEVTNRLRLFGIEKYDEKQVSLIVKQAENKEYRIAEWKGGKPEDSLIEMDVNPDGMKAYLRILPPKHGGKLQTKASLLKSLNDAGIKYGIKEDNLDLLIRNQVFFSRTLVAEGTPPGETKHGYIKVHFESNGKPSLTEDFSGRVDLKNVGFIQTVKKGELLAERVHPEKGESGMDVFGKELPSPEGTRPPWRLGDNCQLSEDDEKLYSKIDGRPVLGRDGSIRVDEVCLLNNVDYSTGNVDFPGTIIVEGRIADDFKLSTRGSLIIKKSVGRVFLSADGDIVLNGGVMGKGGGSIESKADIYAKFCEQAYLK